ncbi:MAG: hypothetical protein WDA18_09390 [Candidatus Ratteibacteria bacterium]|jgi:hypothetical protein
MNSSCLRAGVAVVDITCVPGETYDALLPEKAKKHIPREFLGIRLEVDDPVSARVLALDDGKTRIVLITMDVTAIGARSISQNILSDSADDFMPKLRARLNADFALLPHNIGVYASHTHQTPRILCDDSEQLERVASAVGEALRNLTPVEIGIGTSRENTLTFNRTIMLKNGTDYTLPPYPLEDDIDRLRPIDSEIGILRVDRLDGTPLAVVYNFASHLLLGSPKGNSGHITADHVGVTRHYLESAIGAGATAFFLQGSLGDVNELTCYDYNNRNRTIEFGTRLGQSVLDGYTGITVSPATIALATRQIAFPLRNDIPDRLVQLSQKQEMLRSSLNTQYAYLLSFKEFLPLYLRYTLNPKHPSHPSYHYLKAAEIGDTSLDEKDRKNLLQIKKYLERIQTMEEMTRNELKISMLKKHQEIIEEIGSSTINAEITGIRIGDCLLITAPMEILTEVGLHVKKMSPFPHTFVISLANGYLHYAAPASYYPRGGYEVTECLLSPEWEELFYNTVQELFEQLC